MPVDPWDNFLFDFASQLTGGFVTDLKTTLLAAVLLGFILMGFDKLRELLVSMSATSAFDKARKYFNLMRSDENLYGKDSPEYDYHSRVYGVHMNNAVNQSFAAGKPAYEPDIISTDDEVAGNSDFTPYVSGGDEQLEMESSSPSAPLHDWTAFQDEGGGASVGPSSSDDGDPGPSDADLPGWI